MRSLMLHKKKLLTILLSSLVIIFFGFIHFSKPESTADPIVLQEFDTALASISPDTSIRPKAFLLDVPYVSEAPQGDWTGEWVNACEEATIAMVDGYYKGKRTISMDEAVQLLETLFLEEQNMFGSSKNTDALQMYQLVTKYELFDVEIKQNPTEEDIKDEIYAGRPVISLHRGFDLHNPHIPFSPTKSSYHTIVIIGYDDDAREFITHDPGDDVSGVEYRYSYDVIMQSMHDYNSATDTSDGVPTILTTNSLL